jgi:hypothetical protein
VFITLSINDTEISVRVNLNSGASIFEAQLETAKAPGGWRKTLRESGKPGRRGSVWSAAALAPLSHGQTVTNFHDRNSRTRTSMGRIFLF